MNTEGAPPLNRPRIGPDDAAAACDLAKSAGELLLAHRGKLDASADRDDIRRTADRLSHIFLVDELASRFPHDAVLSEEGADDQRRLTADRVWIIDPLDGTREFGESGRTDWAVHVALVQYGQLVAGAVSLPAIRKTYSSYSIKSILTKSAPSRLRVVVSRTRRPEPALRVAKELKAELVEMGSAGAKAMAVVCGDADIYAHTGGQYEWDSAAPVAVARAAGLHVSRIDGSELAYNQTDPWLPDLLICRPELASRILSILAR